MKKILMFLIILAFLLPFSDANAQYTSEKENFDGASLSDWFASGGHWWSWPTQSRSGCCCFGIDPGGVLVSNEFRLDGDCTAGIWIASENGSTSVGVELGIAVDCYPPDGCDVYGPLATGSQDSYTWKTVTATSNTLDEFANEDVRIWMFQTGGGITIFDDFFARCNLWIDLLSFNARSTDNGVVLRWETGAEIDCLGFNLFKTQVVDKVTVKQAVKLNKSMIPARGSGYSGAIYNFTDHTLTKPGFYKFVLTEVSADGKEFDIGTVHINVH
ncbi:hypothetical protein ACFL27_05090 [candidate division CSSED10-310 bacterium]|uniref:Uncharacterized protein n=1 Tax=candidate division CSSED10-310 bacterium TaxID=2855610 RepID=A0ABV6YU15_UNCC1